MDQSSSVPEEVIEVRPDDDDEARRWNSCCFKLHPQATVFFSQFSMALIVIIFCCYQLVRLDNCEAQSLYSGIITLILGIYCPSPKMRKR